MRIGPRLPEPQKPAAKDYVAIVLAVGFATAVNMITIAFVIVSVLEKVPEGLGENTTQVLITAFSGMEDAAQEFAKWVGVDIPFPTSVAEWGKK